MLGARRGREGKGGDAPPRHSGNMPACFHPRTMRSTCSLLASTPSSLTQSSNPTAHGPVSALCAIESERKPSRTSSIGMPCSPSLLPPIGALAAVLAVTLERRLPGRDDV